jgi:hypothetical protein
MIDLGVTCMLAGNDQHFMRAGALAQLAHFETLMKSSNT